MLTHTLRIAAINLILERRIAFPLFSLDFLCIDGKLNLRLEANWEFVFLS